MDAGFGRELTQRAGRAENRLPVLFVSRPEGRVVIGRSGLVELERPAVRDAVAAEPAPEEVPEREAAQSDPDAPFTEITVLDDAPAAEPEGVVVTVEANEAKLLDEKAIPTESYDPLKDLVNYRKPPVTLLEDYISDSEVSDEEIFENKTKIEDTLKNFGIPIQRIKATVGPTVTLYEIVQAQGIKISKVQGLENDIAQSLKALGIRIIAPIPGKGTIGIEVPNRDKQVVSMYSAVRSLRFQESKAELPVVIGLSFLLGFIITISEPDLQVLANQVPAVPNMTLILSVACGVGTFLVVALLRMLFSVALPPLLLVFYGVVFVLAMFVPKDFLSVAFDSGGVTTGPMTVPFIMALGVGISATRSDRHAADDSFGLVALCSIGPILAVMILSMIFKADSSAYTPPVIPEIGDSKELFLLFARELPAYMKEIAVSLLPIILFFMIFQIFMLKLTTRKLKKIAIGLVYTYAGLVLFLTGVNVGFMPAGNYLGQVLAKSAHPLFLVPIAMIMGYFIVKAEPAVYVLNKQVEEITDGAISSKAMGMGLSLGVAVSLGLAMVRVLTGISILWFLIPGYAIALGISFFVPKIYTAIAFDSGGVASGPMTAAFLLPMAQGACSALGGNIVTDAFGVVAMVAMTPLITIQVMGLASRIRAKRGVQEGMSAAHGQSEAYAAFELLDDDAIIEL